MYDLCCVGVQLYEQRQRVLRIEVYQESGPHLSGVRLERIENIFSCICITLRRSHFLRAVYSFRGRWSSAWSSDFSDHDRISPLSIWFENQFYRFYIAYNGGFFLDPRDGHTFGRYPL